jgi:uncharacterized protein (TIGR00255 family)
MTAKVLLSPCPYTEKQKKQEIQMISMTGYGKASVIKDEYEIEIELKSVNAKFLDLKTYIPKDVNYIELPLRTTVNQFYKRGTIELRLRYVDHTKPEVSLNEDKLKALNTIMQKIMKTCHAEKMPIEYILREYDIIELKSRLFELVEFNNDVIAALKKAIANQQKMARKEGLGIRKVILESVEVISGAVEQVESTIPTFRKELFEKMKARVSDILPQSTTQNLEQRLMQELAIYLDKYDIQEELNRLKEHIDTLHKQMAAKAENDQGKTLNFILQEMQREANTLGSKYSNYHSFSNVLLIKEEIEKCREIIQNVM